MLPAEVDLLVIGGGINGAGVARAAAGRGLSVLLSEKGDLAGATSSASSKRHRQPASRAVRAARPTRCSRMRP